MAEKNRTLYVLKYLWDKTDGNHPATIKDIIEALAENGISASRKTITADIEQLSEIGIDIICNRSTQNQYHIGERVFEIPEVKLLVDAVQSSCFITQKKSKALIKKLSVFVGEPQADLLERQLYVEHRVKAGNETIYLTVDVIHQAIQQKRRVTFQYYEYTPQKEKVLKHEGQIYCFSPFALIWNDDCYYAIGHCDIHQKIVTFRVDSMCRLALTEQFAVGKPRNFDVSDYFSQVFSMYDGKECQVKLLCENDLMKYIIDRFGEKVCTAPHDEQHFIVTTIVSLSNTFYGWVVSFGGKMKLIALEEAVNDFLAAIDRFK